MEDDRLKKTQDPARRSRADQERSVTENRELQDTDRLEMFRQSFSQALLPDLPKIPGYHVCWLTTQNPRDSIMHRLRLGYELIKAEEVPGYESVSLKTGDYAGIVGVNEMVAAKLPMQLYELYMREAHHDAPNREAQKLADTAEFVRQEARQKQSQVFLGDGYEAVAEETTRRPLFSE